jgi:phage baseplate assembly protein W
MTDELNNNPADEGMDTIDDDLTETMVPVIDSASPDALAAATEQASEQSLQHEEARPDIDEVEGLWAEVLNDNPHVTVDNPILKRQKTDPTRPYLAALKVGVEELNALLRARDLLDISEERAEKLTKEERRLINLSRSMSGIYQDIYFDDIDKDGNWGQFVLHNETKLGAGKVKTQNMKDPIMAIRASFGQGSMVQVPLWNTGLWITFRAPSVQALLDFEQRCRLEKMNLGRSANGMVFSSIEVYTVETYMRFALEHMVSVNYAFETGDTVDEMLRVIRSRDYQQVLWGLICAMYPDGYPLRQPCVADPEKCSHVDEVLLNFARMGFVDRTKINDKQALMMASRNTKRDSKWLEEYQQEFPFFEKRLPLGNNLTAVLRVPSLAQQIDAGHLWVDGIAKATNEAFGARLTEMDRVRHIMRSGALTNLRQYSHWFASFEHAVDADSVPQSHDDYEAKDRILEVLSEDPQLSEKINKEVLDWIKKSTVSYVALPKIKCPACQGESDDTTHPHLIPIDIGYVFFTLAALKISQVEGAVG